ncbi:hypothetical protein QBC37DRAFT_374937 [Rhypophila decipiens]|uniref:Uncharacterized protein n=1 Tax=Rhypophila decipiens TaxID=261697 RepID=A0AAN6Y5D2_9PEZI|nr:hypothetical protein QBC37DRAFT_374937 [Rhypophila decipiens]
MTGAGLASSKEQQSALAVPEFTNEYFLARAAEVQDQLRQQNPDLQASDVDLKLSSGWWQPMFDLSTLVDESLPKDVNDKLQAACKDFVVANYSREALSKFSSEARALLAGHDEALRLFESTVLKNPGVWDKMHEHTIAKQEKRDAATKGE